MFSITRSTRSALRCAPALRAYATQPPKTTANGVTEDKEVKESVGDTIKEAGQALKSDGSIGKNFNPDGKVGSKADAVGGPFSKDGIIGRQFTDKGLIGGTGQAAAEAVEDAGKETKK